MPNAFGVSLARNRRSPKRPSEPRPSGVHPEEAKWDEIAKPYRSGSGVRVAKEGLEVCLERTDVEE